MFKVFNVAGCFVSGFVVRVIVAGLFSWLIVGGQYFGFIKKFTLHLRSKIHN